MGSPLLWFGNSAKLLKKTLDFFGGAQIVSGTANPQVTPQNMPIGSLYLNETNGLMFRKYDSGSTTGFDLLTPADSNSLLYNTSVQTTVASNAMTVALKVKDGTTNPSSTYPCIVGFRSATSTSGAYSLVNITGALSLVVPSTATLGMINATATYLWIYLINNAGTAELAISHSIYDDGTIVSTTTIAGASNSNSVIYSTTGRSNVAIRMIARILVTETTAGTWATAPAQVSLATNNLFTDTVYARYTQSSALTVATSTNSYFDFSARDVDSHNIALGAGSGIVTTAGTGFRVIAPTAGRYSISTAVTFGGAVIAYPNILTQLIKNGNAISRGARYDGISASLISLQNFANLALVAGDRIEVLLFQSSGVSRGTEPQATSNHFSIIKIGNL